MEKYATWRELLYSIIRDGQEKQRMASELGINAVTLTRWANNTSKPRYQHLRSLFTALPQQYRAEMQELIPREFPDFPLGLDLNKQEEEQELIASDLYARVFHTYALYPHEQRSWNITNLILRDALVRLDTQQKGLAVTLVQCTPPSEQGGMVYSLRERTGVGSSPWQPNREPYAIFLGTGSLSAQVVAMCHPIVLQSRDKEHQGILPVYWADLEMGAAAYPIYRESKVAGCLLVSSAISDYFTPYRQKLMEQYAELLSLVFEPDEFYPVEQIDLRVMPKGKEQEKALLQFRSRVEKIMRNAQYNGAYIDVREAERMVWKEMEREFYMLAAEHKTNSEQITSR